MSNGPLVKQQGSMMPANLRGPRTDRIRSAATAEVITEFLVFTLGSARMGLPLASVQEILKMVAITEVPRASHDVLGILSVRGRITTVLDLRRRLGQPSVEPTRHTRILLVAGSDETLGLVVDTVLHVVRLREDEIEASSVVAADLPEHVLGLGRPRRRDAVRGVVGASDTKGDSGEAEVIVLLDPDPLLRR
ncbi:chemotaxis protein CheW [Sandaracinus amylolyticus]|uniref:Positive regulator of CheA protein activity n=1 Tax=Sandaracinus amylolyticus TaxID=927083 RepID=A0A0F6W6B3_9BACT|nr:chemotaxis protein CheW [Sandaracinus amylolyticus]AKF08568.1 Positive regulator of CheA protein activity [Sandaracinus amylolyticus]